MLAQSSPYSWDCRKSFLYRFFCIDDFAIKIACCLSLPTLPSCLPPRLPSSPPDLERWESNLPIFDLTKWAERGQARHRLTVDYEQTEGTLGDKCWKIKTRFVILSFFTLHCHNILSFVINYTSSSSIIVLLGKWDNIEHILCLSKRSKVFRQTREPLTWTSCCVASHHKRSVLAASTCVKITCCFTKTARSECRSWGVGGCGLGTL